MLIKKMSVLAAAGLLVLWSGPARAGEEPERPIKIGVVDVAKVFENYKRTKDDSEKMKLRFGGRLEALEKRGVALQKKALSLKNDPRAPDDLGLMRDKQGLAIKKKELEQEFKKFLMEKETFHFKRTRLILAELREAVRRYAETNGYALVIQVGEPKIEGKNTMQVTKAFRGLTALYFSKAVDLTPTILAMLDRAYERGISLVREETLDGGQNK